MFRKTLAAAVALCVFSVTPMFAAAQDNSNQYQIISVMPDPDRGYGMQVYNAIPMSDQANFITWLNGFTPDQRVMVVRSLHRYSMDPDLTPFDATITPDVAMPIFVKVLDDSDQPTFTNYWNGWTPDQRVAFVTYARDLYPPLLTDQDPDVFKNMGMPEGGYGVQIYHALKDTDRRGFITWLNGYTPQQRVMIIRDMYAYGTAPDMTPFTVGTTSDVAMPVLVKVLSTSDQPVFTNYWTEMSPDQQKDFIMYAKDIYPLTPVTATVVTTTPTVVTTTQGSDIFSTMPAPVDVYGNTIYTAIPVSDQPGFMTWINGFAPDQRVMVVRTLHFYSVAPNLSPYTSDTTPTVAYPVFENVLMPEDQSSFTTFWNNMTPDQQASFINYARDVYPSSTMTTTTTTMTPTTTITDTSGTAAQPFGITMAAAFVGYLPEAEHVAYNAIASDTPVSELGGMNTILATLTPDQAGMVVHALASIDAMGKGGAHPKEGMSDMNTKALYLSQLMDSDKSNFETMWNGLNDQQRSSLEQLARDAFNGGMNDTGMSPTATPSGNGS